MKETLSPKKEPLAVAAWMLFVAATLVYVLKGYYLPDAILAPLCAGVFFRSNLARSILVAISVLIAILSPLVLFPPMTDPGQLVPLADRPIWIRVLAMAGLAAACLFPAFGLRRR